MKQAVLILTTLLLVVVFTQSLSQTTPTIDELKDLKSIRGKIPGTIVWCTLRHGTWQIYKMNADGTDKIRLTHDKEENHNPVWSREGQWIYYQQNDDKIYRMRPDGSESQIVVESGFSFDISEYGSELIYVTEVHDESSIVIRDLKNGNTKEIIPALAPEFRGKKFYYPTLSPDGQWVAFTSDYPRPWTVHMVKMDGSRKYQFARGCMPQYQPDGSTVIWITSGNHKIYMADPEGKNQTRLVGPIPHRPHCYFPRWSDSSEYIVFAASPNPDRSKSDYEIYIKAFPRGKAVRLTFHPKSDIWPDIFVAE